jgi:hypothetical protein
MNNDTKKDNILDPLNNPPKSNWPAKPFVYVGGFFLFLSLLSLFRLNFNFLIGFFLIGFILVYIGYRTLIILSVKKLKSEIDSRERYINIISDEQLKNKAVEIINYVLDKSEIMIDNFTASLEERNIMKVNDEIKYKSFIELVLFTLHLIDEMVMNALKDENKADKFISYSLNYLIEKIDADQKTNNYIPNFSEIIIPSYKRDQEKYRSGQWDQALDKKMLLLVVKIGMLYGIPVTEVENAKASNTKLLDDIMSLYENSWAIFKKFA